MCDVPRHIPNTNQSNRIVNINTPNVSCLILTLFDDVLKQ